MPLLIIEPQLAVGGCAPRPRKLSDDSAMIDAPSPMEKMTIMGVSTFGNT